MLKMMNKQYLIYKILHGKVTAHIQREDVRDNSGQSMDIVGKKGVLEKLEIKDHHKNININMLIQMYPLTIEVKHD